MCELSVIRAVEKELRKIMRRGFKVLVQWIPPKKGLRILLKLDNSLYRVEGVLASRYGGGVHTKHRHTNYHRFFSERIRTGEKVLDLGCGNGALTVDVAKATGAKIIGIDLSLKDILAAKRLYNNHNVRFIVGDATKHSIRASFDVVILSNMLEHLPNRTDFLRDICKTIGPKRLLIRVPLFERDWRVPLKKELGLEWRLDPTHEIEYTLDYFEREMEEAGLRISHREVRWGEIWAELVPKQDAVDIADWTSVCPGHLS